MKRAVRVPPVGLGADTVTVDPTWTPSWRRVVAPIEISSSALGRRPATAVSSSGPRTGWPARASTVRPSTRMSPAMPAVMAVIPGVPSIVASSWFVWASEPVASAGR